MSSGSLLISSDLIASQLLLQIVHCIQLPPQSVLSHLVSTPFLSSHLSRLSPSESGQVFAALRICFQLTHLIELPATDLSQLTSSEQSWSNLC